MFFLSDGQPSSSSWLKPYRRLTDKATTSAAPNIIACGVGVVKAQTILEVATQDQFAFVTIPGVDIGAAIAKFFVALTSSIVQSGRSLTSANPELVVNGPKASTWRSTSSDGQGSVPVREQQAIGARPRARPGGRPGPSRDRAFRGTCRSPGARRRAPGAPALAGRASVARGGGGQRR